MVTDSVQRGWFVYMIGTNKVPPIDKCNECTAINCNSAVKDLIYVQIVIDNGHSGIRISPYSYNDNIVCNIAMYVQEYRCYIEK